MTRNAYLMASLLACLLAGLFVAGAGARSSVRTAPNLFAFSCAAPSATDVADSDFFWYWPCASFLHVSVKPAGEALGYVRSVPYAIDCPSACTRPFAQGAQVNLTAYPSEGATFDGWSGAACEGQGNPCLATVNGDTQVTANFGGVLESSPPETSRSFATLRVFMGYLSGGSVTGTSGFGCTFSVCAKTYPQGTSVTLSGTEPLHTVVFCDSTVPGVTHASPYSFPITSTRRVDPHPAPFSC